MWKCRRENRTKRAIKIELIDEAKVESRRWRSIIGPWCFVCSFFSCVLFTFNEPCALQWVCSQWAHPLIFKAETFALERLFRRGARCSLNSLLLWTDARHVEMRDRWSDEWVRRVPCPLNSCWIQINEAFDLWKLSEKRYNILNPICHLNTWFLSFVNWIPWGIVIVSNFVG